MNRRYIKEEDAVTHVIEFTIALTVFVIILQAFTSSMNFRIGIDLNKNDNNIVMAREVISELTGSQGSIGSSTNWEDNEFGTGVVQLRNGTTVGILNSNGEIDSDKKILPNIGVSKGRRLQNTIILNASVFVDASIKKLKAIPGAIRPNVTPE